MIPPSSRAGIAKPRAALVLSVVAARGLLRGCPAYLLGPRVTQVTDCYLAGAGTRGEVKQLKEMLFSELSAFVEEAEERGFVTSEALEDLALEHDLDEDEVLELRADLERREIRIDETSTDDDELDLSFDLTAVGVPDSLTLFMNELGR